MAEKPPEIVPCAFCGALTSSYQLVSQVPTEKCPQEFILSELLSIEEVPLQPDEYICFEHEDLFRIKHTQSAHGQSFNKSFFNPYTKTKSAVSCAVCSCTESSKFHCVGGIKTLSLRNFVINEMKTSHLYTTRRGSGVTEIDHICSAWYQTMRGKILQGYYSPQKKKQKTDTNESSTLPAPLVPADDAVSHASGVAPRNDQCILCKRSKTDGQ